MPELKDRLKTDLTTAMKARDELTTATLRMVLTAVTTEEVAGKQARELSDDEVLGVHPARGQEAPRGGRGLRRAPVVPNWPSASAPRAPCSTATCQPSSPTTSWPRSSRPRSPRRAPADRRAWALVMKAVQPQIAGRADGKRVSDEVRRQLA